MNKFLKKLRWAFPALLVGIATSAPAQSTTPLDTALTTLQGGVTDIIDKVVPVVAAILVALLAFVGLFMAWKYVRKAAGK